MRKPAASRAGRSSGPPPAVALALLARRATGRRAATIASCTGRGTIIPACLRTASSSATSWRVAGDEAGAVAGQVGPLGQRVQGQQAGVVAAADVGVQHRHRLGVPAELAVALVGGDERPALPGPVPRGAQLVGGQDPAGRVGRRVQPDQRRRASSSVVEVVAGHEPAAGDPRADLVRRVGHRRERPPGRPARARAASAARRPAPWCRSPAASRRAQAGGAPAAGQVVRDRLPQRRRAGRSAGSPGCRPPSASARRPSSGVGSTGVPTDRSTMPSGWTLAPGLGRGQRVPREVGQLRGQPTHRARAVRAPATDAQARSCALAAAAPRSAGGPCRSRPSSRRHRASRGRRRTRRWRRSSPSTPPACRPRRRSPRRGRPARRHRSRRTRRGGCRASACPRRCSRPGTPRRRRGPSGPHTAAR